MREREQENGQESKASRQRTRLSLLRLPNLLLTFGTASSSGARPCDLGCPVEVIGSPWPGPARFYSWHPPGAGFSALRSTVS
jgi:hypothetical protein